MWGRELTLELYNLLSDNAKTSSFGKGVKDYLDLNRGNQKVIDISLEDEYGKIVSLKNLHSKLILINFWASWCVPCRAENKELIKIYHQYKSLGFEVIAISFDYNRSDWLTAINKNSLDWINLSDLKGWQSKVALTHGIYSLPSNFLIKPDGTILLRDASLNELSAKLTSLLE